MYCGMYFYKITILLSANFVAQIGYLDSSTCYCMQLNSLCALPYVSKGGQGGIPPMSPRSLTPNHLRGSKLGGKGNFGDSLWFRKFSPLWILTRGHVCTLLFIYFLKKKLFILARWLNVCLWCFDNSGRKILASIVVKVFLLLEYVLRYSV